MYKKEVIFLWVQPPYLKIQVCSKSDPEKIRDLTQRSSLVHPPKEHDHHDDKNPENHQPQKRKAIGLCTKENKTPEKINNQLNYIYIQRRTSFWTRFFRIHPGCTDAHQCIKDRPYHRKQECRRGKYRFAGHFTVNFHPLPGQQPSQDPDTFRCQDPPKILCFFHLHHPFSVYVHQSDLYEKHIP